MVYTNSELIKITKEITIAELTNSNVPPTGDGGAVVADFMQAIFDKLVELNSASK